MLSQALSRGKPVFPAVFLVEKRFDQMLLKKSVFDQMLINEA